MAGTLIPLKDKIKAVKNVLYPDLKMIFDDLSAINTESQNDYPCLLIKPPESTFNDKSLEYQVYAMDMFLFDTELSNDIDHWTEKWNENMNKLRNIIGGLFQQQPDYVLTGGNVNISLGHFQHNDKLIGARARFNLRVYYGCVPAVGAVTSAGGGGDIKVYLDNVLIQNVTTTNYASETLTIAFN